MPCGSAVAHYGEKRGPGSHTVIWEKPRELACAFGVSEAELRRHAESYESRPPFLVELAKRRLLASARLIGEIVERRRAEEEVRSLAQFPEENPNPVLRIAEDGGLLYANAAARACLAAMGQAADQPLPAGVQSMVADAFRQEQGVEAELDEAQETLRHRLGVTLPRRQRSYTVAGRNTAVRFILFCPGAFWSVWRGIGGTGKSPP